jgi:hypothetical protein
MKRFAVWLIVITMLVIAANGPLVVAQQDDAEATLTAINKQVSRLNTRAAKVESTLTADASDTSSDQPEISPLVRGQGWQALTFNGKPDDSGLAYSLQLPDRPGDMWAATVWNTTDQPMNNLWVDFQSDADGPDQWAGASQQYHALVLPVVINPGEFGWATGGYIGHEPKTWNNARLVISTLEVTNTIVSPLTITSVRGSSTSGYSGSITNTSGDGVGQIEVDGICFDAHGFMIARIVGYGEEQRVFDNGESASFTAAPYDADCSAANYVMTAIGYPRDA